jgi:predicted Zn-dependent protease
MVVQNRAADRFLVLNGLERGASLKPGERYKLVTD